MGTTEQSWKKYRQVGVGTFKATSRMKAMVTQVLDSGRISYGPLSMEFERRFAELHGCIYAILSNSGTSALQVALQAMKELHRWEDGYEVIVPATTFVATANIVLHCRMRPVFVDVDYSIDPSLIEQAVTKKTCVVIPVHLFGQAAEMNIINGIVDNLGIRVIEDSCETMFVKHFGRPVGSLGDIGCFSTYVAHMIVTGVGGISTTNDPQYAAKMRSLVNHGLELEHLNPDENFAPRPAPGRRFRFASPGHSFRITELEAALGLAQLENDEYLKMMRIRSRNADHLYAGLTIINRHYDDLLHLPTLASGNTHCWMMFPIVLRKTDDGQIVSKEPIMKWLNENGIETRDMLPILGQPAFSYLKREDYPVSDWIEQSGFYVGVHQDLEPDDIQYVVDRIGEFFDRQKE